MTHCVILHTPSIPIIRPIFKYNKSTGVAFVDKLTAISELSENQGADQKMYLSLMSNRLVIRPCEIVSCMLGLRRTKWSEPFV